MRACARDEPHRAATPLGLLLDLVFVVAVAQAASGLHHGIADNHAFETLVRFAMSFFSIWLAGMLAVKVARRHAAVSARVAPSGARAVRG